MNERDFLTGHSLKIEGINVIFPHQPYAVQEEFMKKVITCLKKGVNGLLESPTGTGKTLSLLCSTLAWLEARKATQQAAALLIKDSFTGPDAQTNSISNSFLTQVYSQLNSSTGGSTWGNGPQTNTTKIIYSSRTHSQLSQVVQELKNSNYKHVPAVVLGSRDQLCVHPEVSKLESNSAKLHQCRLKVDAKVCPFHLNLDQKLQSEPAYQNSTVLDIEDLVSLGRKHTCCPYYAARNLKAKADVVFTPYNYLVDPKTRKAHGIDLQGNVLIFDEAHNIENVCEESMSFQIKSSDLATCINEVTTAGEAVGRLESDSKKFDTGTESFPEFNMTELSILKAMLCELEQLIDAIAVQGGDKGVTKPGSYIFELLSKVDLNKQKKEIILDVLDKVIQFLSGETTGPWGTKGAGLQKFSDMLKVIYASNNARIQHLKDELIIKDFDMKYKVHIQLDVSRNQSSVKDVWSVSSAKSSKKSSWILNCWCFSPGLSMEDLMSQQAHCMILTSGTLAPLESFASELEIPFPVRLENPHIISDEQVTVAVIPRGPDNVELNASFQHRSKPEYLTSLGRTVQQFARLIPDGLLVFFPSYAVMKMCIDHWQECNLWDNICSVKEGFVEPKGKDAFQECIQKYYAAIEGEGSKGAVLFAVCRGKVSEGLDFADRNARAVIITGLPFPPAFDPRVTLKKSYLDGCLHKQKLKGHDWYRLQALRAVNQAVGRVIRHRKDYGAVLLCDSRFADRANQSQLSLWVRNRVKSFPAFGPALKNLRDFFKVLEQKVSVPSMKNCTRTSISREKTDREWAASLNSPKTGIPSNGNDLNEVIGFYLNNTPTQLKKENVPKNTQDKKQLSVFDAMDQTDEKEQSLYEVKQYSTEVTGANSLSAAPLTKRRKINIEKKGLYGESTEDSKKQLSMEKSTQIFKLLRSCLPDKEFQLFRNSLMSYKTNKNVSEWAKSVQQILASVQDKETVYNAICSLLLKGHKTQFQDHFPSSFNSSS